MESDRHPALRLKSPQDVAEDSELSRDPELALLVALERAGIEVAPYRVVPAAAEEAFYRLNNLPDQLRSLYAGVDPLDPDEDDLEELAPKAGRLVMTHYLLDEFIDAFYDQTKGLPGRLQLRRSGSADVTLAAGGRPALLALKRIWAADWRPQAVMARLASERSIALAARAVIVQPEGLLSADDALVERVQSIVNARVSIAVAPRLGVTHLAVGPP